MDAPSPLTRPQLELLRLFNRDLPEREWEELRDLIARYFAERLVREADRVWEEKGWADDDAERLLHGHERRASSERA